MTDGPGGTPGGAEQPAGTPSSRALGAMESAVRRVRASASGAGASFDHPTPPDPYRPPAPSVRGRDSFADRWTGRSDRWLLAAVAVAAVAVVALAVALIVSLSGGASHVAAPPVTSVPSSGTVGHQAGRHGSSSVTTSTTSTSTIAATPGGPPVIDSITPANGAAGQTISITGANFMSSDGQIVASFNGTVAATSCPAQNTCTVTVPPSNGASSAQVTITTAAGASNAVPFAYT